MNVIMVAIAVFEDVEVIFTAMATTREPGQSPGMLSGIL
jgi:hypothetical protein